jgi:uncharacterized repeat protein (TIGR01451 family)
MIRLLKRFSLQIEIIPILLSVFIFLASFTPVKSASAVEIFVVTQGNTLISFDSATPGTISTPIPITGLVASETIEGIDFRPLNGQLYGLGSSSRLYTIDTATGAATQVGSGTFTPALSGSEWGFDFNPSSDRIRVVSNTDQNFRLNPDTAAGVIPLDTSLSPGGSAVQGAAYTNNFVGATQTTVYVIDTVSNLLMTLGGLIGNPSPNGGMLINVGSLGVVIADGVGFDIADDGMNTAFAALNVSGLSQLYNINLNTGAATLIGNIGNGMDVIKGLAVTLPVAPPNADLNIAKTAAPNPAQCVQEVTYTITISNNGPDPAENVEATDPLPVGLQLVSISSSQGSCDPDTVSCALGTLDPGVSATIEVTVTPFTDGDITNTATVTSTTVDPNSANNGAMEILSVQGEACVLLAGGGCSLAINSGNNSQHLWPLLTVLGGGTWWFRSSRLRGLKNSPRRPLPN